MPEERVTFELTEDDVAASARFVLARRMPIRPNILVVCALVAGTFGILLSDGPDDHLLRVLGMMVIVLAIVLGIAVNFIAPWQARKHFRELAAAQGEMTFSWADEGAVFGGAKGETRLNWAEFHRWGESDDMLVLMQSSMFYNLLPKRALTATQLSTIRERLESAGVKSLRKF